MSPVPTRSPDILRVIRGWPRQSLPASPRSCCAASEQSFPVGSHNVRYDVALSLPSVVDREGVGELIRPAMSANATQARKCNAGTLKNVIGNSLGKS